MKQCTYQIKKAYIQALALLRLLQLVSARHTLAGLLPSLVLVILLWLPASWSTAKTVTTYVVTTQEERESTRFTLTEWLRIKERMKMMDVWLAMFSEPEKSRFRPELSLFFGRSSGLTLLSGQAIANQNEGLPLEAAAYSSDYGRAEIWLTNLISSTFGVRTLNIDLGAEAYLQKSAVTYPANTPFVAATMSGSSLAVKDYSRYTSLDLRIFGKNIQDSSIVLKYGEFTASKELAKHLVAAPDSSFSGTAMGAELQLYLTRWLGFEAHGHRLISKGGTSGPMIENEAYDVGLYLEISLFRVMGGIFTDTWHYRAAGVKQLQEQNAGRYMGFSLNL